MIKGRSAVTLLAAKCKKTFSNTNLSTLPRGKLKVKMVGKFSFCTSIGKCKKVTVLQSLSLQNKKS